MQTRGAIVRQAPGKYEVVDLEVDDPRPGEVQVKPVASGLRHSDDTVTEELVLQEIQSDKDLSPGEKCHLLRETIPRQIRHDGSTLAKAGC